MTVDNIAISDFQGLQALKLKAQADPNKALPEVAKQFEAVFLQSMLKSMRMGQHFIDDSSPFRGKSEELFQDMLDGQYASNIASGPGIGFADMLVSQLQKNEGASDGAEFKKEPVDQMTIQSTPKVQTITTSKESTGMQDIDDFVKSVWPYARQAATMLGLDPKILMAQAALETGWGQHVAKDSNGSSSNNLFNIKAASKDTVDSVQVKTTEYVADTPIQLSASFRKYPSVAHSFSDYVSLIKGSDRYEAALANSGDPERYVDELHRAGYATDPRYASKILSIYHGDELERALQRNGLSGA